MTATKAGWTCFYIGVLVMLAQFVIFQIDPVFFNYHIGGLYPWWMSIFICAPLLLAAFTLSIVGMAQGKVKSGILLLVIGTVISVIGLGYIYSVGLAHGYLSKVAKNKRYALSHLEIEGDTGYVEGNYMICTGIIKNNSPSLLSDVEVGVEWLDKNSNILDKESVELGSLMPNGKSVFKIKSWKDSRMKKYRCSIVNAEYVLTPDR